MQAPNEWWMPPLNAAPPRPRSPAHLPPNAGLVKVSVKRSGLKVSGSFHRCGEWCRFQTEMNRSAPLPIGYLRGRGWVGLGGGGGRGVKAFGVGRGLGGRLRLRVADREPEVPGLVRVEGVLRP